MRQHHAGFQRLLLGRLSPGVWSVGALEEEAADLATRHGWMVHRVDLRGVSDKAGLLDRMASALDFPDHFARSWDATFDCLVDRAWRVGAKVLLLVEGGHDRTEAAASGSVLRSILDETARDWGQRGVAFFTVWIGAGDEPSLDYWLGLDDPEHPPLA